MPNYSFECRACGHAEELFFRVRELPRVRKCGSCGKRASRQDFGAPRRAQINAYAGQLYGKWHPQAGEVIRDYYHKRELMRKYGWNEAGDPVGGNRKLSEESMHEDSQQPEPSMGGMAWADPDVKKDVEKNPHQAPEVTAV